MPNFIEQRLGLLLDTNEVQHPVPGGTEACCCDISL